MASTPLGEACECCCSRLASRLLRSISILACSSLFAYARRSAGHSFSASPLQVNKVLRTCWRRPTSGLADPGLASTASAASMPSSASLQAQICLSAEMMQPPQAKSSNPPPHLLKVEGASWPADLPARSPAPPHQIFSRFKTNEKRSCQVLTSRSRQPAAWLPAPAPA